MVLIIYIHKHRNIEVYISGTKREYVQQDAYKFNESAAIFSGHCKLQNLNHAISMYIYI